MVDKRMGLIFGALLVVDFSFCKFLFSLSFRQKFLPSLVSQFSVEFQTMVQ